MKELDIHLLSELLCMKTSRRADSVLILHSIRQLQQRQGCANKPEQNNNDGHQIGSWEREPFRWGPLCRRNAWMINERFWAYLLVKGLQLELFAHNSKISPLYWSGQINNALASTLGTKSYFAPLSSSYFCCVLCVYNTKPMTAINLHERGRKIKSPNTALYQVTRRRLVSRWIFSRQLPCVANYDVVWPKSGV